MLYSKEAASGTLVTLGTNGQSSGCVGYTVFGVRSGSTIKGDINNDGKMDIADAVLLQKWLLTVPGTELQNREAADLCEDGILNVFDLCLMKQLLLEG